MYTTIVGDWSVDTTHSIDTESLDYEATCADAVQPTIAFAADWGSTAHAHTILDPDGTRHEILARLIEA